MYETRETWFPCRSRSFAGFAGRMFHPHHRLPPEAPAGAAAPRQQEDGGPAPFTVDIRLSLGDDAAAARFLAGPSADQLKGICSLMETVVLDDNAAFFTAADAGIIDRMRARGP
ncbi:MAG: hypothetical protein LBE17_06875 [Treponema sp.]|nr:hypothetical protein [Treponema sp.]